MSEAIPKEVLEAARLRFKRRCAALICQAMAEDGRSVAEYCARLGWKEDRWWSEIKAFIEGTTKDGDKVADLATAMDCEIRLGLTPIPFQAESANEAEPAHD